MTEPRTIRSWTDVIALRRRGLRSTTVLTLIAASGGWVWLGPTYACLWFVAVMAGLAANRGICDWIARRSDPGRALEWTLTAVTFAYTALYCVLPFGLTTLSNEATAWIAGAAMLGAISLSSTSEFVISRRIGFGSLSALFIVSILITIWRGQGEPLQNVLFGVVAIAGFHACILQFAMHRVRDDRRFQAVVAEAEAANAAKSMFLATMSHEIRTPLNGVLGMAQAMAADEMSPVQHERLVIIRDAGHALTNILNDVLDLSKIEAGKLELEIVDFDLGGLLRASTAPFAVLAAEKGLTLTLAIAAQGEGLYRGDPVRLRQVVGNLLSNALKFTDLGRIDVSATPEGGNLRILVADTGPGLPPDQVDRLFGKFAQLDASTTRRHGGTGLGLAICRDLCRLMGGDIRVESVPLEGARFIVTLPLVRVGDVPEAAVRTVNPAADRPGLRVLAAEDTRINQIVLETVLAQAGITPVLVVDGEQAVRAWAAQDWDLILMDVHMPVLDGVAATREIRRREAEENRPRTPIIALTANAMTHQVAELLAAGMDQHVAKPIDVAKLFGAIEAALEAAEAARETGARA